MGGWVEVCPDGPERFDLNDKLRFEELNSRSRTYRTKACNLLDTLFIVYYLGSRCMLLSEPEYPPRT
jgi:hypothetical protein